MKADNSIPLVGHPEQIGAGPRQWPNVASDHSLPFRHALTEARDWCDAGVGASARR